MLVHSLDSVILPPFRLSIHFCFLSTSSRLYLFCLSCRRRYINSSSIYVLVHTRLLSLFIHAPSHSSIHLFVSLSIYSWQVLLNLVLCFISCVCLFICCLFLLVSSLILCAYLAVVDIQIIPWSLCFSMLFYSPHLFILPHIRLSIHFTLVYLFVTCTC